MLRREAALFGVIAALAVTYVIGWRPWLLAWGATGTEQSMVLPGDEIVSDAGATETRAITIDAPIAQVWPWVAQTGQDRGGFYSYDLVENMVGCEMPTVDYLRPEKQEWKLGDRLWMYPPEKAGGAGYATLRRYEPGRVLGFATRMVGTSLEQPENGSWTFILSPIDAKSTRLIIRGRGTGLRSLLGLTFDRSIFEPMHFAMEKRQMIGIKQLAEGRDRGRIENHAMVVLWFLTGIGFAVGTFMVLAGKAWPRSLLMVFLMGLLFQIFTLAQPPLILAAPMGALVLYLWLRPARARVPKEPVVSRLPRTA